MSTRKHLKPEIKASILKEFLQKKVPISELCERYSIQPSNIYQWQNQLFSNASEILSRKNDSKVGKKAADVLFPVETIQEHSEKKFCSLRLGSDFEILKSANIL